MKPDDGSPDKKLKTSRNTQSAKQTGQKAQLGGPTIGGVAGVGKAKTITRPISSQSTKTPSPTGVHTRIPHYEEVQVEGKESEYSANRQISQSVRGKMETKLKRPVNGLNDYFSHNASKTQNMQKPNLREEGGAGAAPAVSVAGGAVPSITDPTTNYALQKKMREKLARRKK